MFSGGTRDAEPPRFEPLLWSCKAINDSREPKIKLHGNEHGRPKTAAYAGTHSEEEIAYSACGAIAEDNHLPGESTPRL